jgi:hypothetical protein
MLYLHLLSYLKRIVSLNAEIAHSALRFGMP